MDIICKTFIVVLSLLWSTVSNSIDLSKFPGSAYHPLRYVETFNPAPDVYTVRYVNDEEYYYNHFIVTEQGVIVLDPTSDSAAAALVKIIREKAPGKTLAAIVYSHLHLDHIAGARILREELNPDAMIIAHERTDRFLKWRKFPIIELPTHIVGDQGAEFSFGNIDLQLKCLGYGHTNSILVPVFPQRRLAYAVDFANGDVVGWTTMPGWDIDELQRMKYKLLQLDIDQVLFGHGLPGNKETIQRQLDYYNDLRTAVSKAIEDDQDEDSAVTTIELSKYQHFWNYKDWFKDNVRGMYQYLTSQK